MRTERENFKAGGSSEKDFWRFVNERHAVWVRRVALQQIARESEDWNYGPEYGAPWTDDEIIAGGKFTNVFRELDRGTIALRRAEEKFIGGFEYKGSTLNSKAAGLVLFNVMWQRMLNRREHSEALGFVTEFAPVRKLVMTAAPLFTQAHQTYLPKGVGPGEGVRRWYAETFKRIWNASEGLATQIAMDKTLEHAFWLLQQVPRVQGIGPFIAYEIVTDLRRTVLKDAPDVMTWCNINRGGGSARGLRRLGLAETPEAAKQLLVRGLRLGHLAPWVLQHVPRQWGPTHGGQGVLPLLELREVEHALCEFDKYERVRTGLGTTRGGAYRPVKKFDDGGFGDGLKVVETPAWGAAKKGGRRADKR